MKDIPIANRIKSIVAIITFFFECLIYNTIMAIIISTTVEI